MGINIKSVVLKVLWLVLELQSSAFTQVPQTYRENRHAFVKRGGLNVTDRQADRPIFKTDEQDLFGDGEIFHD